MLPDRVVICPCGLDLAAIERELPRLLESRWWPLLPAVQDASLADQAVRVPAGHADTAALGPMFGPVTVTKAEGA